MIEFHCRRHHHSDNTPIVFDREIQDYAEAVLEDYRPKLLREPGRINALNFLESYCGAVVEYQDIYYEENESPIAGAAVFTDGYIRVFDRENLCTKPLKVAANTVIIDNSTMEDGKEAYALFTELHEGGHLLLHACVYNSIARQVQGGSHMARCCRSTLQRDEKMEHPRLITQEDFREHQANTFAASLAMPRSVFLPYVRDLFRQHGFYNGVWVIREDHPRHKADRISPELESVCDELARTFGVSRSAARVHLWRNGLLMTEQEFNKELNAV